jgi:N-acetylglucosaminyldiphosphoundecaprenol N-acetyl-beta-D-mannosaminyltransferase
MESGAAIAFLSGGQANIRPWVDKLMLGWLARCLHEPRKFVPRYLRGVRLIPILSMYADR